MLSGGGLLEKSVHTYAQRTLKNGHITVKSVMDALPPVDALEQSFIDVAFMININARVPHYVPRGGQNS